MCEIVDGSTRFVASRIVRIVSNRLEGDDSTRFDGIDMKGDDSIESCGIYIKGTIQHDFQRTLNCVVVLYFLSSRANRLPACEIDMKGDDWIESCRIHMKGGDSTRIGCIG